MKLLNLIMVIKTGRRKKPIFALKMMNLPPAVSKSEEVEAILSK
jgi:hypothetical protein